MQMLAASMKKSIFVVDKDNTVTYVEYVPEIGHHPDCAAALTAVRESAG
jgi:thiol peroxidase